MFALANRQESPYRERDDVWLGHGGQPGKPVGTVWFGWAWRHGQAVHHRTRLKIIEGDREEVRRRSVITALNGVLEI